MGIRLLWKHRSRGVDIRLAKPAAKLPTVTMPVPKKITLLMQQHIGAPAKPVVKKGDKVLVGSLVGQADGACSADIHSGVSGKVAAIEDVILPGGGISQAVVIEADGEQTMAPGIMPPIVRDRESFLQAVASSGLVGLGGAGFPTALKLNPPHPEKVDTLIVNASECEPLIASDEREMLECGDTVLSGIMAVQKYLGIKKTVIAVERDKPGAMDLMFSLTKGDSSLHVFPLETRYPQGAEKVLIEAVTAREVPAGKLPADVGVLMLNVSTVSAIGKYLISGLPLVTRRITVEGGAVVEPKNVDVIVGTPVADVIEFCGGYKFPPKKLIFGGPMMGIACPDDTYPVTKQNNGILALAAREVSAAQPQPCIRCGRCVAACPVRLSPIEINEAYEKRDLPMLQRLWAQSCIGCGNCSYICPARRLVSPTSVLAREWCVKEAKKQ